jgi:hypothetical protein
MLDRRDRALPNDYARLRWQIDPRVAFGPQRIIAALANVALVVLEEIIGPVH